MGMRLIQVVSKGDLRSAATFLMVCGHFDLDAVDAIDTIEKEDQDEDERDL